MKYVARFSEAYAVVRAIKSGGTISANPNLVAAQYYSMRAEIREQVSGISKIILDNISNPVFRKSMKGIL